MKSYRHIAIILTTGIGFFCPQFSNAAGIDFVVDFGSAAAYQSPGNVTNITTINSSTSITVGYDGSSLSGISLTSSGANSASGSNAGAWGDSTISWVTSNMGRDFINFNPATNGGSGTITISGLGTGSYSVELVSSMSNTNGTLADIQIAGSGSSVFASSEYTNGTSLGDNWSATTNGYNNILIWDSIASTGTITITLTDVSSTTNLMYLNALRVTSVPEPAQVASGFGGLAFLGAWISRRKRRA